MIEKPDCKVCKYFNERKGINPCEENLCEKPKLLPANEEALFVWERVSSQFIMSPMGGPIDVNYEADEFVMNLYGVRDKQECFEKVTILAAETVKYINDKIKLESMKRESV